MSKEANLLVFYLSAMSLVLFTKCNYDIIIDFRVDLTLSVSFKKLNSPDKDTDSEIDIENTR